ncbi:ral guanine nucleotide dissociation stimulator-like [Manis pentadactyla]|uniref:ral guanine nucleotide dissociation stimulator-like n=1 Tax=Manis pentadactyla TaxID=143292 RepID=UPI00255C74CF|nr:ral guanine nucleotide dissociation stimulator-like [Manis pentadactyla]
MGGIELLAPNVQMVIRQFDAMVSLVISSCLGTLTMTAQDRAQVVEFWIRVAKECLALKNFAALRAILVGLRSRAILRLGSTWRRVSWWVVLSLGPGLLSGQGHPYILQCPSVGWDFLGGGRA